MSIILLIVTTLTLYLDISKHYNSKIKESLDKIFGEMTRSDEKDAKVFLTGSSYMALGFLLTCLFFEKGLTITSWLILVIADSAAALVGTKIGKPLENGKSIAGSVAFATAAFLISIMSYFFISYKTSFMIILLSCLITTLVEFYSTEIRVSDNLCIPLIYALSTVILSFVL